MIIFSYTGTAGDYLQTYHNLSPHYAKQTVMGAFEEVKKSVEKLQQLLDDTNPWNLEN